MRFSELLRALDDVIAAPSADAEISAPVSEDNRTIKAGGVFVARMAAALTDTI
ncbi:MAG: hypothetical protein U0528_18970 [Anaerolineae bacterium]